VQRLFDGIVVNWSRLEKETPFEVSLAKIHKFDSIVDDWACDAFQVLNAI
jgi:hypothetical protein